MLRNREFIIYIFISSVLGILAVMCFKYGNIDAACIMVASIILLFIGFTLKRYAEMKKLSEYLTQIQNLNKYNNVKEIYGYLTMDNYKEGELSILKTEIYKVTRMLMEQKDRLQEDKVFLSDSLADISHQIKTPLTSLTIMSDLIADENLSSEKRKQFICNIHIQINRLDWLVSTLLKMSRLDAGTVKLNPGQVSIKELIEQSFNHLLIPMELKSQTLKITGDNGAMCICDRNWTVEAIANIGKNCIEHTGDKGAIRVHFEENNIYSSIYIEDNGSGIDREDIPHIFQRFYKGRNSSKDSVGIGLAFSKQIISMENGTIDVESELGKGTKFYIRFYKRIV